MASNAGIDKITNIPLIFPDTFFDIPHPDSPWIAIQFRTGFNNDITQPFSNDGQTPQWTEITINPSNFFDNITIEDESGFQRVEINLVDQYFTKLETIITQSIISVRENNQLSKTENLSKQSLDFVQFKVSNTSFVNMRVRFGYGNPNVDSNFIDDTDFSGTYESRVNGATVIRSPWIYLQILNVEFKLNEYGLLATITAISTTENWLDKAKILKRFYVFKNTPKDMLRWIRKNIEQMSKGITGESEITVEYEEPDPPPKNKDNISNIVEISLGEEADEKSLVNFKTVRSFLDELCSKIPLHVYNSDSTPENNPNIERQNENMERTCRYSYMLQARPGGKHKLKFFYPDPLKTQQNKMRVYVWREYGQSIVKSMDIQSRTDFAALNYQLTTFEKTYKNVNPKMFVGKVKSISVNDINNVDLTYDNRITKPTDVTDALKDFDMAFVSDVVNLSGVQASLSALATQQIVHFLNQGVFQGTINLPGDPFYLFDSIVRPFEYMIKVVVLRPGFLDENGKYTAAEGVQQSYLSGYYLIKKITHKIDNNGFGTSVEIMRWPLKE